MKYLKEQEKIRFQTRQDRLQKRELNRADENMRKSIKRIQCKRLFNCPNAETQLCFSCKYNKGRDLNLPPGDYYKEKIPGVRFF